MLERLLIAETTIEKGMCWKQSMEELHTWQHVWVAADGEEACTLIEDRKPDAVILAFDAAKLDGLGVLEWLHGRTDVDVSKICMLFYSSQLQWMQPAYDMGADYCAIRPCKPELLYRRFLQLQANRENEHLRLEVAETLTRLGILPHVRGYHYILDGIMLVIADETLLEDMTNRFYPALAHMHQVSNMAVERAMRHAIETAWRTQGSTTFEKLFDREYTLCKKPSNSEFIGCLAVHYRYHYNRRI